MGTRIERQHGFIKYLKVSDTAWQALIIQWQKKSALNTWPSAG